jgi:hypothetical protein
MGMKLKTLLVLIGFIFLFSCGIDAPDDPHSDWVGGDDTYELGLLEQVEVQLQLMDSTVRNGEKTEQVFHLDLMHPEWGHDIVSKRASDLVQNNKSGVYKVWVQHIWEGSKGPFEEILDTGMIYLRPLEKDSSYDFRVH